MADIWIISDGKPGHLNQSLGLAEALVRLAPALTFKVRSVEEGFGLLSDADKPKLIICAGRKTHLWSWFCKLRYRAKCVVLMRPSLPLSCFDMVFLPEHDAVTGRGDGVEQTRGALNRMVPGEKEAGSALVLVGGPSKHVVWSDREVSDQIYQIIAANPDRAIAVATSRRTPASLVEQLQTDFDLEIIPPESVSSDWLPLTLGNTERVWVTADSVSMVFEALTAGCAVSLISLESQPKSRTQRGMRMLLEAGLVDMSTAFESRSGGASLAEARRCAEIILEKRWL